MQLKNDEDGRNGLRHVIGAFYREKGRVARIFLETETHDFFYVHCLVDRRQVIRYGIGIDRRMWIGGVELGIGPYYFPPSDFWDDKNDRRFSMEASAEAVVRNLRLLDEFFGYLPPQTDLQPLW